MLFVTLPGTYNESNDELPPVRTPTTPHAGEDAGPLGLSLTLGGTHMVQPLRKTVWWFLIKLNTPSPHGPAITLLGIYPKELKTCPHKHLQACEHSSVTNRCPNLEQPRHPLVGQYSVTERKRVLSHAKTPSRRKCTRDSNSGTSWRRQTMETVRRSGPPGAREAGYTGGLSAARMHARPPT